MSAAEPNVYRLSRQYVEDLHMRMWAAEKLVVQRAQEQPSPYSTMTMEELEELTSGTNVMRPGPNSWVMADEFLAAFTHLHARPNLRLACFYTPHEDERQSRLVLWQPGLVQRSRSEAGDRLPPIPEAIRYYELGSVISNDAEPAPLPAWISWDVPGGIADDGSPEAVFERSIFCRWIAGLLNRGHFVGWPRHHVFAEISEMTRGVLEKARSTATERLDLPADWRPIVHFRISGAAAANCAPTAQEGRDKLRDHTFSTVTFYSYSGYLSDSIYRHQDWHVAADIVWSEGREIAVGGSGYMV